MYSIFRRKNLAGLENIYYDSSIKCNTTHNLIPDYVNFKREKRLRLDIRRQIGTQTIL